jgi:2-oxoglutarate ferredoxin oxidoreductase subunit alpha
MHDRYSARLFSTSSRKAQRHLRSEAVNKWMEWQPVVRTNEISVLVGGEAGAGISAAGSLLGRAFLRGGLHVFGTIDYPSLIRGGHNFYLLRAASQPVYAQWDTVDLIIAFDARTIQRHKGELVADGGIIYDSDQVPAESPDLPKKGIQLYPIPLQTIVKAVEGAPVVRNTVAMGAAVGILNYDFSLLESVLRDTFADKGSKVVEMNQRAARAGYEHAQKQRTSQFCCQLSPTTEKPSNRIFLSGNEAVGVGAIAAGCKFYAAYPMTPASGLLHFMIAEAERYGFVAIQPESEIAAINMAIGASYAGVRAMTSTSGGGFCLMTEALGLAAMTETPLVVLLGQRTGPSTGLATYTGQADLRFALHAGQGEFPRVIIAPGDAQECFDATIDAFNLAEEFQLPVIILGDKQLLESDLTADAFRTDNVPINRGKLLPMQAYAGPQPYLRHQYADDGISPRLAPGTPGALTHTESSVHKEIGFYDDGAETTRRMADKRYQKLPKLRQALTTRPTIKLHGAPKAKTVLVGWGSPKGAILEALRLLKDDAAPLGFLQVLYLEPFPTDQVREALKGKRPILIEGNQTAQLGSLIKEHAGITINQKILRYDGRPFFPVRLAAQIKEAL